MAEGWIFYYTTKQHDPELLDRPTDVDWENVHHHDAVLIDLRARRVFFGNDSHPMHIRRRP